MEEDQQQQAQVQPPGEQEELEQGLLGKLLREQVGQLPPEPEPVCEPRILHVHGFPTHLAGGNLLSRA